MRRRYGLSRAMERHKEGGSAENDLDGLGDRGKCIHNLRQSRYEVDRNKPIEGFCMEY